MYKTGCGCTNIIINGLKLQMVAEASTQSFAEQPEQHASDKEHQEMKEALNQAEVKIKALEGQIEVLQKVRELSRGVAVRL